MSNPHKKKTVHVAKSENSKDLQKVAVVSTIVVVALLMLMYIFFLS